MAMFVAFLQLIAVLQGIHAKPAAGVCNWQWSQHASAAYIPASAAQQEAVPASTPAPHEPGSGGVNGSGSSSSSGGGDGDDDGVVRYIIRFNGYDMASELQRRLVTAFGPESTTTSSSGSSKNGHSSSSSSSGSSGKPAWRWVPRNNRAAQHPTDFALVELAPGAGALASAQDALRAALAGSFRDVHPDKRFTAATLKGVLGDKGGDDPKRDGDAEGTGQGNGAWQEQLRQRQQERRRRVREQQQQEQQQERRRLLVDGLDDGDATAAAEPPRPPHPGPAPASADPERPVEPPPPADSVLSVAKRPGRLSTRPTIGLDPYEPSDREASAGAGELRRRAARRLAQAARADGVTALLKASELWDKGFSGEGVKVGVFDTGIREDHPHIRKIKERTNWTHQNSLSDGLGHGTFVAGVIGSSDAACPGFAPDIELYTFKVFTDDQVSYTSWFLDAFNYAVEAGVNVINLSIGGPDYLDAPFVDKVKEVTASGILMVSAIGNDGPLYGTLNNPADQSDVIGVGGIDNRGSIASFSSRGMTTHELPIGIGRIKPDVMAYAKDVSGSKIQGGCRTLSGTSVASPVVAGCVALLASTVPPADRWRILNPASMKQALVEGAEKLPELNAFEQGSGRVDLAASAAVLAGYQPRASLIPSKLDLTDCPYLWPYCKQPLYAFGMPAAINATVLNGMGATGRFSGTPVFEAADEGGRLLSVTFTTSDVLWPWSGFLGIFIEVSPAAWNYSGTATGHVVFTIESPPPWGSSSKRTSTVRVPLRVAIAPTPPRERRVLWDQFHSVRYPPGYIPRDNLDIKSDILDWHGDHLYTNYHETFNALVAAGYYVEVLSSPASCVDLRNYGSYLVVDSEDEWYPEEVAAVEEAVKRHGLQLMVFAEWYHADSLSVMKFFDDNTRSWWTPVTGGANVPALNDLLAPHGVVLGDAIVQGSAAFAGQQITVSYGTSIYKFPAGSHLFSASFSDVATKDKGKAAAAAADGSGDVGGGAEEGKGSVAQHAVMGFARSGKGGVAIFGDSNCLDSSHQVTSCNDLLIAMLDQLAGGHDKGLTPESAALQEPYVAPHFSGPPRRREGLDFKPFSFVLSNPLLCHPNAPCRFRGRPGGPGECPKDSGAWRHTWMEPGKEPAFEVPSEGAARKAAAEAAKAAASKAAAAGGHGGGKGGDAPGNQLGLGGRDKTDAGRRETAAHEAMPAAPQASAPAPQPPPATGPLPAQQQDAAGPQVQRAPVQTLRGEGAGVAGQHEGVQRKALMSHVVSAGSVICVVGLAALLVLWRKSLGGAMGATNIGGIRLRGGGYIQMRRATSGGLGADAP